MKIPEILQLKFHQKYILIFTAFIFSWLLSSPALLSTVSINIEHIITYSIIRFFLILILLLFLIYLANKNILEEKNELKNSNRKIHNQQKKLLYSLKNDYFFYRHFPNENFNYISKSINNILGYSKEEFIQYITLNNITALTNDVFKRAKKYALDGILIPTFEIELVDRKGDKYLFEVSESPVFNDDNEIIAIEAIVHNLSDHYHNIFEDISFEDKYNILYENSNDAILIIKQNKFIDCNNKALEIFDCNYEKIIMDSPFSINFSPFRQPNNEISKEIAIEKIQQARIFGSVKFYWQHLRGNKEKFDTEVTLVSKKINNEEIIYAFVKDNSNVKQQKIKSNTDLEEIFNNSRALLYKLDIETGKYDYLSNSAFDMTGYKKEELIKFSKDELKSLLHPSDLNNADNIITKLINHNNSDKTHSSIEYRFKHKSGEYKWFSDSYRIVNTKDSSFIIGNVHDITRIIEYRIALKESELRFRKTVDNIQNGISIYENNKITYVNDKLVEITGYSKNELMKLNSLTDLAIEKEKDRLNNISENKNLETLEFWITRKDGKVVCIQNRYSESSINESLYGKYVISTDISEQKKLELALVEREAKYRNLTDKLPQAIFEINTNGILSYINQSGLEKLGYKSKDLINKVKATDLTPKNERAQVVDIFNRLINKEAIEHIELNFISKKGPVIPFRIYPGIIIDNDVVTSIRGIMIDISNEQSAKEEIKIAKQTVKSIKNIDKSFFTDILRDMVAPVNSINGMINLIESTKLTEEQYDFLKVISKSSESLSELMHNIKEIAISEESSAKEFNLTSMLKDIKDGYDKKFEESNIVFLLKQDFSEHINIVDEKEKIKLITNSIISLSQNLIKEGFLELEVKVIDKKDSKIDLNFKVKNNGIRVDDEQVDIINDIINNPKDSDLPCVLNDRLKLNVTVDLINNFNGKLEFLRGKKGSNIFSYNLSLNYSENEINNINQHNLKNTRILLAEDQLFNQMVIKTMARNWDCKIDVVEDGEQAIESLKQNEYDLILMDIHMPRMDGMETIKYIRANCPINVKSIPIIAITGDVYKNIDSFGNSKISNLIIKPFTSEELFKSIVKALGIYSNENHYNDDNTIDNGYYSLEIINKLAKGNEDIKRKMIRVFVIKTQEELAELENATNQENWDKVFSISHKMKPAFGYLKITTADLILNTIIDNARSKKNTDNISDSVKELKSEIITIIDILKSDFKDIF